MVALTTKQAVNVFGRWMHWQRVYKHHKIDAFSEHLNGDYWDHMASACAENEYLSIQMCKLFGLKSDDGFYQQSHFIEDKNTTLTNLFNDIENDFMGFIDYLGKHHFFDPDVNQHQSGDVVTNVIDQYVYFLNALFYHPDGFVQGEYLFSVANKTFEFCFSENTYGIFFRILNEERYYPLARLLQSIVSQFLSSEGWRDWHADTLKALKKEYLLGKKIVYIAGGSDIYALLASGVYNIEVIDPLLPSQAGDYYSEGWSWLAEDGNIGDILQINNNVTMCREKHEQFDTFQALIASGEKVNIAHTETTWSVYDASLQKMVGRVLFKRRFVNQGDFIPDLSKTLLLSFNELYLLGAPYYCDGWGIKTSILPSNMLIFVKQLQHPITAGMLKNLAKANDVPFKFINLGGCAT